MGEGGGLAGWAGGGHPRQPHEDLAVDAGRRYGKEGQQGPFKTLVLFPRARWCAHRGSPVGAAMLVAATVVLRRRAAMHTQSELDWIRQQQLACTTSMVITVVPYLPNTCFAVRRDGKFVAITDYGLPAAGCMPLHTFCPAQPRNFAGSCRTYLVTYSAQESPPSTATNHQENQVPRRSDAIPFMIRLRCTTTFVRWMESARGRRPYTYCSGQRQP